MAVAIVTTTTTTTIFLPIGVNQRRGVGKLTMILDTATLVAAAAKVTAVAAVATDTIPSSEASALVSSFVPTESVIIIINNKTQL